MKETLKTSLDSALSNTQITVIMPGDLLAGTVSSERDSATPQSSKKPHKRKRDPNGPSVTTTPAPSKKQKRNQSPQLSGKQSPNKRKRAEEVSRSGIQETPTKAESAVSPSSNKATSPSAHESVLTTKKKSKKEKRRTSGSDVKPAENTAHINGAAGKDSEKSTKNDPPKTTEAESEEDEETKLMRSRHSKILSKFKKSIQVKSSDTSKSKEGGADIGGTTESITAEPVVAQGLEPLPQPAPAPEPSEIPTYSSLPSWLADPLRVSTEKRAKFSEFGIDEKLLNNLEQNGYKEAFAVQSAVIPLLLPGSRRHPGDVCISAATGSGKTLSYVLPLVTALEQIPTPRLRGLIVVPTRELVKQARETCELCASGSGLKIGSAVGNIAIKDEQHQLMRLDQVYDPVTSKMRQQMKLTGDDWTNFSLQDYVSEAEVLNESLPGYVDQPRPNVDILICTPGRLVDHIRYTKGFTLRHLQWLVIDEADRLLNESFQEWVDVVMGSLDARKSPETFGFSGNLLSGLGLPINSEEPRKVILSATMTRDITKLNSLRLVNPKLVVIDTEDAAGVREEDGRHGDSRYSLPPTLKEYSVSVGDGSTKPLYLLRLLLSHIKVDASPDRDRAHADTSESEDSSEDSSSDDSSSDDSNSSTSSDNDLSDTSSSASSDSTSDSDSDSDLTSSDESSDSQDSDSEQMKSSSRTHPSRTTVLIFTKSSESASRLSRLLSLLHPPLSDRMGTIIKSNKSSASRKALTAYRRGKISVIVATDRASRGLDLPSLSHVVNYDVPPSVTSYVHRVGRTARAGREGTAWTLVAHREGRWFANEIAKGSDGKITRSGHVGKVNVKLDDMDNLKTKYEAGLDELEKEVRMDSKPKP